MDYITKNKRIADGAETLIQDLGARRIMKGYSQEDLSLATGLTIAEIIAAEKNSGELNHVDRIKHVLR